MASEFSVACSALRDAVTFASLAIERRNTIPTLSYCLIHVEGSKLSVSGTNLDQLITRTVDTDDDAEIPAATFLLQPKPLLALLSQASGRATITVDKDLIQIVADGVTARFNKLLPAEDWPEFAQVSVKPEQKVTLSVALMNKMMRAVSTCISTEETRYYLNGIFLQNLNGRLKACATDGHRLALYTPGVDWFMPSVILPRGAVAMLRRALNYNQNGGVTCHGTTAKVEQPRKDKTGLVRNAMGQQRPAQSVPPSNHDPFVSGMVFEGDGWSIKTKLIDGTFPDYTRVVPEPSDSIEVSISRHALRRLYGSERSNAVNIQPDRGEMTVNSPDLGFTITAPCTGHGMAFGINPKYLAAFTAIHDPIRLTGSNSENPFRVATDDPDLLWILMPMRV